MQKIGNCLLVFIIFFAQYIIAAPSVAIEINPQQFGLGDQIQISLVIQSDSDLEVEEPQFPATEGLQMVQAINSGQSSSTRMNFINGKSEFSKTVSQQYDFIMQVTKAGLITIPSFQLKVNGQTLQTAPQKMNALKTAQNSAGARQRPQGRGGFPDPFADDEDDVFSQLMKQRQRMMEEMQKQLGRGGQALPPGFGQNGFSADPIPSRKLDVNTKEAFIIYLDVDKKEVYEGEQITANWYIYTRGNLETVDRAKFPDLKGFWKEIIEEIPGLQFTEEDVNGVRFRKAMLASHALFPIKPGTAVIDEFKIKGKVRLPTQFGWGQLAEYTKSSKRTPITVLPLPTEGKPLSFSGAVGQFQIQTQIEGLQFPTNQPFSIKIRFEGSGNAKLIELPPIQWPEGLEVYDTKSESKFFKDGQSYKEFEVLLVPKKVGEVKLPAIHFSYFDPQSKQYVTKSTEEMNLKIIQGSATPQNVLAAASGDKNGAMPAVVENLTIMSWPSAFSWQAVRIPLIVGLILFGLLAQLIQFILQYRTIDQKPQLKKRVDVKIQQIKDSLKKQELRKVGAESVNLIYLILSEMSQNKSSAHEWSELIHHVSQNYRDKYEKDMHQLFDYFQTVGFAPNEFQQKLIQQKSLEQSVSELSELTAKIVAELPNQ